MPPVVRARQVASLIGCTWVTQKFANSKFLLLHYEIWGAWDTCCQLDMAFFFTYIGSLAWRNICAWPDWNRRLWIFVFGKASKQLRDRRHKHNLALVAAPLLFHVLDPLEVVVAIGLEPLALFVVVALANGAFGVLALVALVVVGYAALIVDGLPSVFLVGGSIVADHLHLFL